MLAPATKKLPCNHIFHRNCLRSWFQRQQTCPTCRLDVLRNVPQPTAAAAAAAGAARIQFPPGLPQQQQMAFQNQIQQMRAQLDAMQQRGNAPPGMPQILGMPGFPQMPGMPQVNAARQAPAASTSTTASTTSAAAGSIPTPAAAAGAPRPQMFLPPFPFMPFTVPPPLPPPNFQGLSDGELAQMEGTERQNV